MSRRDGTWYVPSVRSRQSCVGPHGQRPPHSCTPHNDAPYWRWLLRVSDGGMKRIATSRPLPSSLSSNLRVFRATPYLLLGVLHTVYAPLGVLGDTLETLRFGVSACRRIGWTSVTYNVDSIPSSVWQDGLAGRAWCPVLGLSLSRGLCRRMWDSGSSSGLKVGS